MLSSRRVICGGVLCLLLVSEAAGATSRKSTPADLTSSSAWIFRGVCEKVEVGSVEMAGARLPVTTYSFRVSEWLKGHSGATITFRQVGARGGGPTDLGRLAGLPSYLPGHDYLLLLLPESRAGLTSPSGAAQGAFEIVGDRALALRAFPGDPATYPLATLRRQILQEARR